MKISTSGDLDGTRAPTLKDVARHAGVSTATVSRSLNQPDRVVEETRNRVLLAIDELSYSPNFGARALAARRTDTFGAVIPTMENAIFARGIQAFQEELDKSDITLLVASSSYRPDLEEKQIRALAARGAEALLLIGHQRSPSVYEMLDRRRIPFVVTWAHDPSQPHPSIGFDNKAAMRNLAGRVIELGHRALGFISAPCAMNDRARGRHLGLAAALEAGGIDPIGLRTVETPYSIENGASAFVTLMRSNPRPTAVLCGNDVLAAGAIAGARSLGLRVPEDVSITGFDDIEIARIVTPPLTTVRVPHQEMGRQAARMLLQLRDGASGLRSVKLEADIRARESLARSPDG